MNDWLDALSTEGWALIPDFIPASLVGVLCDDLDRLEAEQRFRPAAIGAGASRIERPSVRGERICWFDEAGESVGQRRILSELEQLRVQINQALLLGLHELECHYAVYEPGRAYARHVDRSPHGAERVVSIVLYLNDDWSSEDGGELVLFTARGERVIEPRAGRLVCFLSEGMVHEVRPARRPRRSLAGWYRRRALGYGRGLAANGR
jgi:SM-20-related protein